MSPYPTPVHPPTHKQENRLDAARTTRLAKGPSLFYTSDIENPFHIAHFRVRRRVASLQCRSN